MSPAERAIGLPRTKNDLRRQIERVREITVELDEARKLDQKLARELDLLCARQMDQLLKSGTETRLQLTQKRKNCGT